MTVGLQVCICELVLSCVANLKILTLYQTPGQAMTFKTSLNVLVVALFINLCLYTVTVSLLSFSDGID